MLDRKYLGGVLAGAGLGFLIAILMITKTDTDLGGLRLFAVVATGAGVWLRAQEPKLLRHGLSGTSPARAGRTSLAKLIGFIVCSLPNLVGQLRPTNPENSRRPLPMPIDPYSPCPGGTGKKIKFCCSDLVDRTGQDSADARGRTARRLSRSHRGNRKQVSRSGLPAVDQGDDRRPNSANRKRPTLRSRGLSRSIPTIPWRWPRRPRSRRPSTAAWQQFPCLQDALERCTEQIPAQVYDAIGLVAQALIAENQLLAARAAPGAAVGNDRDERSAAAGSADAVEQLDVRAAVGEAGLSPRTAA